MTPERALEILKSGFNADGLVEQPTDMEQQEVIDVWNLLPGWTCFTDALIMIAMPLLFKDGQEDKLSPYLYLRAQCLRHKLGLNGVEP